MKTEIQFLACLTVSALTIAAGQAATDFASEQLVFTNNRPIDGVSGDLDGDGDQDLIVGGSLGISVLETGGGAFQQIDAKFSFHYFAADLDADGDLDVISFPVSGSFEWFRNDGGVGNFSESIEIRRSATYNTAFPPTDLDGDGDLDLLGYNSSAGDVFGKLNDGSGNFDNDFVVIDDVGELFRPRLADLNGDGIVDLINLDLNDTDDDFDNWIVARLGQNTSPLTFAAAQPLVTDGSGLLGIADVDGDGDADLVTRPESANQIAWLANDGTGGFGGAEQVIIGPSPNVSAQSVAVSDLDGDGDGDVIVHISFQPVLVCINDGAGSFAAPFALNPNIPATVTPLVLDLNADGLEEIIVISQTAATAYFQSVTATFPTSEVLVASVADIDAMTTGDTNGDGHPEILFGTGDGMIALPNLGGGATNFGAGGVLFSGETDIGDSVLADIDGAGGLDLFTLRRGDGRVSWHAGAGDGTFGSAQLIDDFELDPTALATGDFDGNGSIDLVVVFPDDKVVNWYSNNPATHAFAANFLNSDISAVQAVATGDIDLDGDLDIVASGFTDGMVYLFTNGGGGAFGSATLIGSPPVGSSDMHITDIDGDSNPDVIVSESAGVNSEISALLGNGDGTFAAAAQIYSEGAGIREIEIGDLDSDGDIDIVHVNSNNRRVAWLENDGGGNFTLRTLQRHPVANRPDEIELADVDGDGDLDIISAGSPLVVGVYENEFIPEPPNDDPVTVWALALGLPANEAADLTSDSDGDGVALLEEFAFGLNPLASDTPVSWSPTGFTFRRRADAAEIGLIYNPQISADLSTWQPASTTGVMPSGDDYESVTIVPATGSRTFLRIVFSADFSD